MSKMYFVTAKSDIKNNKSADDLLFFGGNGSITYEFEALIYVTDKEFINSKVIMYGNPEQKLIDNVKSRRPFQMLLELQSDGNFIRPLS